VLKTGNSIANIFWDNSGKYTTRDLESELIKEYLNRKEKKFTYEELKEKVHYAVLTILDKKKVMKKFSQLMTYIENNYCKVLDDDDENENAENEDDEAPKEKECERIYQYEIPRPKRNCREENYDTNNKQKDPG